MRLQMCNGSETSVQSKTDTSSVQLSLSDKNDEEIDKSFGLGKTYQTNRKIIELLENQQKQEQIQTKQCQKLLKIYQHLVLPAKFHQIITQNILKEVKQFSAAELLNRQSTALWNNNQKQLSPQRYLKTIKNLSSANDKMSLISTPEGEYLVTSIKNGFNQQIDLMEADPIAIQLFNQRSQFLNNFHRRFTQKQNLSPFSEEIIFLYQKYTRYKQYIMSQIKNLKEKSKKTVLQQQVEIKMKQLTKQLRILKTKRNKK